MIYGNNMYEANTIVIGSNILLFRENVDTKKKKKNF